MKKLVQSAVGGDNEDSGRGNRKERAEGGLKKQNYKGNEDRIIKTDTKTASFKNYVRNTGGRVGFRGDDEFTVGHGVLEVTERWKDVQ